MSTDFHISTPPALRYVTGRPYLLSTTDREAGFFTRLRVAERLVIQQGSSHSFGADAGGWMANCTQPGRHPGFTEKSSHA